MILVRNNNFFSFDPRYVNYEINYVKTEKYLEKRDSSEKEKIFYKKIVYKKSRGFKIKVDNGNKLNYIIKGQSKNFITMPSNLSDTFIYDYFLPGVLYNGGLNGGVCSMGKYLPQSSPKYKYTFVQDTMIISSSIPYSCNIINVSLIENLNFFNDYPIQIFLIKKTGVPLEVRYPWCWFSDSLTNNYSIQYHEIKLDRISKYRIFKKNE